jgi:hypothetical protein
MKYTDSHLSDEQLMLEVDGELSARQAKQVRAHLAACWKCRTRRQELEDAIAGFVRVYHGAFDTKLPPVAGPRALLQLQMERLSATEEHRRTLWSRVLREPVWKTAATASLIVAAFFSRGGYLRQSHPQNVIISIPDSKLTPGAAVLLDRQTVCALTETNNKTVPVALRKKVFEEYGIEKAEPRAYEVDYLVTPALGGADDIRNLWPQSYLATAWNAQTKDALEQRLREMVCNGSLELTEAQHEIAGDWIAAYKKYFHTDRPVVPR